MSKAHIGMFEKELQKIPAHLHKRVATAIHRNVEHRVKEYMDEFRKEVFDDLQK
jgi:hypothetical protein